MHTLLPTTHPAIVHMRYLGDLTLEDMSCDEELGLNAGKPMAVLLDVREMGTVLPIGFLEGARRSFFVNPNTEHMALVVRSPLLKSVALLIANLTGRRDRLSLHDSPDAAEAHLRGLLQMRGA